MLDSMCKLEGHRPICGGTRKQCREAGTRGNVDESAQATRGKASDDVDVSYTHDTTLE